MGVSLKEFSSEPLSVVFWLFPGLLSLLSVTGLKSNIFLVSYHFEKTQRPSFVLLSVLLLTNPMGKKLKPVFNPYIVITLSRPQSSSKQDGIAK